MPPKLDITSTSDFELESFREKFKSTFGYSFRLATLNIPDIITINLDREGKFVITIPRNLQFKERENKFYDIADNGADILQTIDDDQETPAQKREEIKESITHNNQSMIAEQIDAIKPVVDAFNMVRNPSRNIARLLHLISSPKNRPFLEAARDGNGNSIMHVAVNSDHSPDREILKALIKIFPQMMDCQNQKGLSPLHCAILAEDKQTCIVLVDGDCNVSLQANNGTTAAQLCRDEELQNLLMARMIEPSMARSIDQESLDRQLFVGAKAGDIEICKLLIAQGANRYAIDKDSGKNTLEILEEKLGLAEASKLFLSQRQLPFNKGDRRNLDEEMLRAARNGCLEKCEILIRSGGLIVATDENGDSVLHHLMRLKTMEADLLAKEIIQNHEANVLIKNNEGESLLAILATRRFIGNQEFRATLMDKTEKQRKKFLEEQSTPSSIASPSDAQAASSSDRSRMPS